MIIVESIGLVTLVIGCVVVLAKTAGPLAEYEKPKYPDDGPVWWGDDNAD